MPNFTPNRDLLLRAMVDEIIGRAVRLYQAWSLPEYKYASLLSLAVGVSLYLSGFGVIPILWSMGASLVAGHFGARAAQEIMSLYNDVQQIVAHVGQTVGVANQTLANIDRVALSLDLRLTEAQVLLGNLNRTTEHVNSAAETTSTFVTPLTLMANGFRAVGNRFRGNATVAPETETPLAPENPANSPSL